MKSTGTAVLVLSLLLGVVSAHILQYEEDKAVDRELARGLTTWILQLLQRREPTSAIYAQKRNSEIINSLLGLPKVMNEAGRRK